MILKHDESYSYNIIYAIEYALKNSVNSEIFADKEFIEFKIKLEKYNLLKFWEK